MGEQNGYIHVANIDETCKVGIVPTNVFMFVYLNIKQRLAVMNKWDFIYHF